MYESRARKEIYHFQLELLTFEIDQITQHIFDLFCLAVKSPLNYELNKYIILISKLIIN